MNAGVGYRSLSPAGQSPRAWFPRSPYAPIDASDYRKSNVRIDCMLMVLVLRGVIKDWTGGMSGVITNRWDPPQFRRIIIVLIEQLLVVDEVVVVAWCPVLQHWSPAASGSWYHQYGWWLMKSPTIIVDWNWNGLVISHLSGLIVIDAKRSFKMMKLNRVVDVVESSGDCLNAEQGHRVFIGSHDEARQLTRSLATSLSISAACASYRLSADSKPAVPKQTVQQHSIFISGSSSHRWLDLTSSTAVQ